MKRKRPTARNLGAGKCLVVWCSRCDYRETLTAEDIVALGKADVPLIELRFRCRACTSPFTDQVVDRWRRKGSFLRGEGEWPA